jgi:hypothetical protein
MTTDANDQSKHFYARIPAVHSLEAITRAENFYDVPDDWMIGVSDVRGSTRAIRDGKYKQVNAVAAAGITAMLNAAPNIDLPFVFGGDGATILFPAEVHEAAKEALIATQRRAMAAFDLDLRIGIIPVKVIYDAGYRIRVSRLHVSDNFQQAIFIGGGLEHAEFLLKHPQHGAPYRLEDDGEDFEANFSGFECRWSKIPGRHGEVLSLMVRTVRPGDNDTYRAVFANIDEIYGDRQHRHPVTVNSLRLNVLPSDFSIEVSIREGMADMRRQLRIAWGVLKARIAMRLNIQGWGRFKGIMAAATDNEKFDDCLRMTISGMESQREALRDFLEMQRQQGKLVYGMHTSQHALVTCIVFDYFGRQVHFVDGADGGYAVAASQFKHQTTEIPPIKLDDTA